MNHIFCPECGNKIAFLHAKPNFCSKCGSSTGYSKQKNVLSAKEEHLEDDETSIEEIPYIDRISVDIEQYNDNVFSFASLIGEDSRRSKVRNKGSKTIEDFINDKRRR